MRSIRTLVVGLLAIVIMPAAVQAQERILVPERAGAMYSDAVRVGDLIFLSGVVAGGEEPANQFRRIWSRIGTILEESGSSLEHIVDITTYHVDMHSHIDDFIAIKAKFLPQNPSWTAVGVTELYMAEPVVEVKVIAAVAEGQEGAGSQ